MANELKPYKDLDEWIPLSKVVDMAHVDDYDDAQVMRQKFNHWAIRGYRKLNLNLLRIVKRVLLPVSHKTKTAKLPEDFRKVSEAGYYDICGDYIPMVQTGLIEVAQKHKCGCEICETGTLCDAIQYERIEQVVTINGVEYTDVIIRTLDKTCGAYKEQREEHIYIFETGLVEKQINVRNLCTLETLPCGCVKESEENIKKLKSCGCCSIWEYGNRGAHCIDDEFFSIDEENGLIHVGEDIRYLYLKYMAHLPCVNGQIYVPAVAAETLAAWILFKKDARRRIAENQKLLSYQIYKNERKEMRKNLMPIRASVIRNALNLIPY